MRSAWAWVNCTVPKSASRVSEPSLKPGRSTIHSALLPISRFSCTAGWHEPVTRIPQGIHHSLYVTGYNSPANERRNTPVTTMQNTVVAVWMAAAAATIGLAAPAHADDTQYANFLSP